MPSRKPLIQPQWVRYEVSNLIQQHIDVWEQFCRERDRLEKGSFWGSSSDLHRSNPERPRLETVTKLLDIALRQTGPVRYADRLFKSSGSTYSKHEPADESVPNAEGLFVEIRSPINGIGRLCK